MKRWADHKSYRSFDVVILITHWYDEQILLGWKKVGFGQNHFGAFSVIPLRGETTLNAARREMKVTSMIVHVGVCL